MGMLLEMLSVTRYSYKDSTSRSKTLRQYLRTIPRQRGCLFQRFYSANAVFEE